MESNYLDFCFESTSLNPYYNLALEDSILRNPLYHNQKVLMIWRSQPCVVLGRFQNPWLECDLKECKRDAVSIVRRQSGGGTVYHDLGNLNISFIGNIKKELNFKLVLDCLASLGINLEINERNDLLYEGLKVSGSAFKNIKGSALHHLTLLISTPLENVRKYLHHTQLEIETKSIKSKRSEMLKLGDVKDNLIAELTNAFLKKSPNEFCYEKLEVLKEEYFSSREWIYGETPKFSVESGGDRSVIEKGRDQNGKWFPF